MRFENTVDARRDIADWSQPIVGDCISRAYDHCLHGDEAIVRPLARQHCRVWQFVIAGDGLKAAQARRELNHLATLGRLQPGSVDLVDRLVLDELVEVVSVRFRGSPAKTGAYSRMLIEAATTLTETRLTAA